MHDHANSKEVSCVNNPNSVGMVFPPADDDDDDDDAPISVVV